MLWTRSKSFIYLFNTFILVIIIIYRLSHCLIFIINYITLIFFLSCNFNFSTLLLLESIFSMCSYTRHLYCTKIIFKLYIFIFLLFLMFANRPLFNMLFFNRFRSSFNFNVYQLFVFLILFEFIFLTKSWIIIVYVTQHPFN